MNNELEITSNGKNNAAFLASIDKSTKTRILVAIAEHYGTSACAAQAEIVDVDAEWLLEYLTGPLRSYVYGLAVMEGFKPVVSED